MTESSSKRRIDRAALKGKLTEWSDSTAPRVGYTFVALVASFVAAVETSGVITPALTDLIQRGREWVREGFMPWTPAAQDAGRVAETTGPVTTAILVAVFAYIAVKLSGFLLKAICENPARKQENREDREKPSNADEP